MDPPIMSIISTRKLPVKAGQLFDKLNTSHNAIMRKDDASIQRDEFLTVVKNNSDAVNE
jgi:hypothetical protein